MTDRLTHTHTHTHKHTPDNAVDDYRVLVCQLAIDYCYEYIQSRMKLAYATAVLTRRTIVSKLFISEATCTVLEPAGH